MILCDVVLTPLSLSFHCCTRLLGVVNAVATGVVAVDMVVHALTSFTTKRGIVVSGPANTIPHYCFSVWALADFLSCFPVEYFVSTGRFLGGAKVIRLIKISQLMHRFHSARKVGAFRLVRLISVVLLVSHGLTCYWNWIAQAWRLHEEGYLDKPVVEQCVHSRGTVIGSLNASPPAMFTPLEELSVAVFMLIGNVLQASVFGSVAALIQSFDEDEVTYNKKLVSTYERCKMLDIPELLAKRINNYYQHLYRETRSVDPDADAFINELSPALICEVKFQLYKDMIKQIPFFSSANINPVIIEMLILRLRTVIYLRLRTVIYMQDDMLIRKGEFADWMGFIGSRGSVGVLDPNSETHKILRILYKGEYFGETGLLHRTKRTTTAVALSWVQIHVLTRGDLDQVKEQYTEDAESLEHEIRLYMKSRVFSLREGQVWDKTGDS
jgi:hypothetical protein